MLSIFKQTGYIRIFVKYFFITLGAFAIAIITQFGFILDDYKPYVMAMPIVFGLVMSLIIGWNAVLRTRLQKSDHAKSELISGVSHELRTPLTVINGFSRLLSMDDSLSSEQRDYADKIYQSGEHLLHIIDDLLDLSHIESGKLRMHIEPVKLADEYAALMPMLRPGAEKANIELRLAAFDHELRIAADRTRLHQVVMNLVSNAIKYGSKSSHVDITTQVINHRVRISVIDHGPGIPADKIEQLFIPFNRLNLDNKSISGTGIGLSISKRLIEMMHGNIGADCQAGKGCCFWFDLPQVSSD